MPPVLDTDLCVETSSLSVLPCTISWRSLVVRIDAFAHRTDRSAYACDGGGLGGRTRWCWCNRPQSPAGIVKGCRDVEARPGARPATDRPRGSHRASNAAWTAQQLRNAFPDNEAPRYLIHDRDSVFTHVATTIERMNIQEVRTAPRSPWQNAYVERVIGSIQRECVDHVIVMNAAGLHRVLTEYIAYYMRSRTHLALGKDTPVTRPVSPLSAGRIVAISEVGGLHHRYDRVAA